jgi:hypothetical protein
MQQYQVLSGQAPASFGFFDTIMPHRYQVIEQQVTVDKLPQSLPDMLSLTGWKVSYQETPFAALGAWMKQQADFLAQETNAQTCIIVKSEIAAPLTATAAAEIASLLRLAQDWVGTDGFLALLSDIQPARIKHYVNVNNFLADMGIIERDEESKQITWSGSLAYHAGHGQIWINLQGRDVQGSVHPQDEYEEVCDALVTALPAKLRDPATGEAIVERIYRKHELYSGDYLFRAPDLVVLFKPGYAPSASSVQLGFDETVISTAETGEQVTAGIHPSSAKGFLLAAAPAFEPGRSLEDPACLTAVFPTLLHALGVEYSGSFSPAIGDLFSFAYLSEHPIQDDSEDTGLSEEDEEQIINHLRDLGYV